jgi:hypothetical protein
MSGIYLDVMRLPSCDSPESRDFEARGPQYVAGFATQVLPAISPCARRRLSAD